MSEPANARGDGPLEASLTCPACGRVTRAVMPEDSCLWFFECPGCGRLLRPKPGDCCVFCSYADRPCPPVAAARAAGRKGCGGEPAG
jgi:uncharacterized C2H2 Zn-finger protein